MKKVFHNILKWGVIEHILFAVLLILSILLFEERLFADSSYYIFRVINTESFWIEHYRYILGFSQIIPLIGIKIGLGLKTILLLYSINHVIFFYSIFLVTKYYYKNSSAGFFLLLLQTIGISSGFFVPMFELYYAAGLLVLISTILYSKERKYDLIILSILTFFVLTGHPYTYILLLFIIILHAERNKYKFIKYYYLFIVLMVIIIITKKFNYSEYEYWKTMEFRHHILYGIYNVKYIISLIYFLIVYYKSLLLLELITIIYLWANKEYHRLMLVVLAFIGTLILINFSYYGFAHGRYQEQVYFSLSFIVVYSFVIYILGNKKCIYKTYFLSLITVLIIARTYGVFSEGRRFSSRVDEIKSNINQSYLLKGSKFEISENLLIYDPNWSYPIETMLLSSYISNDKTTTICTDTDLNFEKNREELKNYQYLFRRWELYNVESLNPNYFKLDSLPYSRLK